MSETVYDLVIEGGRIWSPTTNYVADIAIKGESIAAIGGPFPAATKRIDARGLDVLPGLWHVHCHFREPGHIYKEDFESGSKAAASGGITFCIDMTNNTPHPTSLEAFEAKKAMVAPKAHLDYALYGGGLYPRTVPDLAKAGAIGIKVFNTRHIKEVYPYISELGVLDHGVLYELYEAVRDQGLVAAVHHDDPEWCKRLTFREYIDKGKTTAADYHDSYAKGYMYGHGMVAGLASSLYYARIAGVRLHVLHLGVMPVGAYEMVHHAKHDLGQQVTAELELASMLMSAEQKDKVGPYAYNWAHSPKEAWQSLADGTSDFLVLEHAPHTREDVEPGWKDNFSVPLGQTGAQEMVPLMLNAVSEGRLSLHQVADHASERPAKTFGIFPRKGAILPGSDGDLTIVDMKKETVFQHEDMLSKAGHTSWVGMKATGAAVYGVVRGQVIMKDGKVLSDPGQGRFTPGTAASA